MNQVTNYIKDLFYDESIKSVHQELKSFTASAKSYGLEQISRIVDASGAYINRKLFNPPCDGTIVCPSNHHLTKCYSHTATDRQWRREMGKILSHAK